MGFGPTTLTIRRPGSVSTYFTTRHLLRVTCHENSPTIFGPKTISPISNASNALTSTAPAATSFIFPAFSFHSGETRSTSHSMAVLNNSAASTNPIAKTTKHHSAELIFSQNPMPMAIKASTRWIQRLCWVRNAYSSPLPAYPKLLPRCLINFPLDILV